MPTNYLFVPIGVADIKAGIDNNVIRPLIEERKVSQYTATPEYQGDVTQDAETLTQAIMAAGILPAHAFPDAAHVAVSAVHRIDYLLTWNCKHLANAQIARRIAVVCEKLGHKMPTICTPEELMGE